MKVYCDADFAGDETTRKSTSGVVCKGGAAVTWHSRRQQCVAQSTEAEYVSVASAAKELVWGSRLIRELAKTPKAQSTSALRIDNMSAIRLIKNPEFHQRIKHIDVRYHYVREGRRGEGNC